MADARKNFATSFVATAPSPATSGTSLVVAAGEGARFATPPFNAVISPSDAEPTPANAEVVRVTGIATDTFTITRAQESSVARSVIVGDAIYAGVTNKTLTDIETTAFPHLQPSYLTGEYYSAFLGTVSGAGAGVPSISRTYFQPFTVGRSQAFDRIATAITANGTAGTVYRMGVFLDNGAGQPGTLLFDAGTVAADAGAPAIKAITISQTLAVGYYWSCIVGQVATPAQTNRVIPLAVGGFHGTALNGNVLIADGVTGAFVSNPDTVGAGLSPVALNPPVVALRAA